MDVEIAFATQKLKFELDCIPNLASCNIYIISLYLILESLKGKRFPKMCYTQLHFQGYLSIHSYDELVQYKSYYMWTRISYYPIIVAFK